MHVKQRGKIARESGKQRRKLSTPICVMIRYFAGETLGVILGVEEVSNSVENFPVKSVLILPETISILLFLMISIVFHGWKRERFVEKIQRRFTT